MPEEERCPYSSASCQYNHLQTFFSFSRICDACLNWTENEMDKAYGYEAREDGIA